MDEQCVVTRQEEELEPTIPKRNLSLDLLCCCIVQLLECSMMCLHLSGNHLLTSAASSWDVAKHGGNPLFHLFGSFHSSIYSTPDVWRHDSR